MQRSSTDDNSVERRRHPSPDGTTATSGRYYRLEVSTLVATHYAYVSLS